MTMLWSGASWIPSGSSTGSTTGVPSRTSSGDLTPSYAINRVTERLLINAKVPSNGANPLARSDAASCLNNRGDGKSRVGVGLACEAGRASALVALGVDEPPRATASDGVLHVLGASAWAQVGLVDAFRVVAIVQKVKALWNGAVRHLIRDAVSKPLRSGAPRAKQPIPFVVQVCRPLPAIAGIFNSNFGPKALFHRFHGGNYSACRLSSQVEI